MESQIAEVLQYLIGAAVVGLVGALAKLWHDFTEYKVHVSEKYINNGDIDEIKQELRALRDVVYRVALKMDVPVFTEPFRR